MVKRNQSPGLDQVLLRLVLFRLFLPLLALSLIALALAGYLAEQSLDAQQHRTAVSLARMVDRYLDQAGRKLTAIARVAEISAPEDLATFMQGIWEAYGYFDTFYCLDAGKKIKLLVPADQRYQGLEMSILPYLRQIREKDGPLVSRPFMSLRTGNPTVYLIRPLSQGRTLVGELNLGSLQREVSSGRIAAGKESVFILDQSGTLLAHPSLRLVNQQTNLGHLEIFRLGRAGEATLVYESDGRRVMGSVARVERTGWVVVAQIPLSVALGPYIWTLGLTLLAFLIIWLGLAWSLRRQLQRQVVAPLVQLSRETTALANGDFSQSAALTFIPSAFAELKRLAADFGHMSNALQSRQAALQESEEKYRGLVERINEVIYSVDTEGHITYISPAVERVALYRAEEVIGELFTRFVHPDDLPGLQTSFARALAGLLESYEFRVFAKDGDLRHLHTSSCLQWDAGQVVGLIGIASDITEPKKAEAALRESRRRLFMLMSNLPGMAYRCRNDRDWTMEFVSQGALALTGYTADELIQSARISYGQVIHPHDRDAVWDEVQVAVQSRQPFRLVYRIVTATGMENWVWEQGQGVFSDQGELLALEGFITDITERKQAEEALQLNAQRTETLLQLNQMTAASLQEITDFALEEAVRLTRSTIGYLAFLNQEESILTMHSWSKSAMAECAISEKPIHYPVESTGLWGETVRQRRPIITNDYTDVNPWKKGYPPGHVAVKRHMNIPVFQNSRIVLVAGVGNKNDEYTQDDAHQLTLLMEGMWQLIDRKRGEEAIRDREEFLTAVVENIPDMVFVKEAEELRFVRFNRAGENLLGYSREELVGKNDHDFFPQNEADFFTAKDREVLEKGVLEDIPEEPIHTRYRGERILHTKKIPITDKRGKAQYLLGVSEDITERKRAEEELKQHRDHLEELVGERTAELVIAKEQAEAANRAKSIFLANMSHDLRTPLNAILGYAQILKKEKNLTDQQRDQLLTVQKSGEHLLILINDILDLARIEAQKEEVALEAFNLPTLIQEILSVTRVKAAGKGLALHYEEGTGIPGMVRGDARKLRQVLLNLLDNAINNTERGSVTLRASAVGGGEINNDGLVSSQKRPFFVIPAKAGIQELQGALDPGLRRGDGSGNFQRDRQYSIVTIQFQVSDTGIGIPREKTAEIFEPFATGRVEGRTSNGIGLGLSICRRLVGLMDGKLTVESEMGVGSTFSVELDLETAESPEAEVREPERAIVGYVGRRKRLLIVDDHPANLGMLVALLEPLGFEVHTAENGAEALGRVKESRPDLVLLDLLMPGMDGHEALRRLRGDEELKGITVIGVSAAVADRDRVEAFAADCDDFISKPVDTKALQDKIKGQLGIEWIEGEVAALSAEEEREVVKLPPWPIQEEIVQAADAGEFSRIVRILDDLTTEAGDYSAFCNKLREYARKYDDEAIIEYVTKMI